MRTDTHAAAFSQYAPSREECDALFALKVSQWPKFWRGHGFENGPNIAGKRVLEFGCGLGAHSMCAARDGAAEVVGLDLDKPSLEYARHRLSLNKQVAPYVTFLQTPIENFSDERGFDFIISYEVLEHVQNLPVVLKAFDRLLKPAGAAILTFGGFWTTAFGGHDLQYNLQWRDDYPIVQRLSPDVTSARRDEHTFLEIPIPFTHRLFKSMALRDYGEHFKGLPHDTVQDVGMNGLAPSDYERMFARSPLRVVRWESNVGSHPAYVPLRFLARVPGLKDLFTQNVYAIAVRKVEVL